VARFALDSGAAVQALPDWHFQGNDGGDAYAL
jgi:hypothetical protein